MPSHLTLHEASVPVLCRYLGNLACVVGAAKRHAAQHNLDPRLVLGARLASDMLPFASQVQTAAGFALRACAPLAGLAVPPLRGGGDTFESLAEGIAGTLGFLGSLEPYCMQDGADRTVSAPAGNAALSMPGRAYLFQYALPNFFFHVTAAYCILRNLGIPLGKREYDGFHVYEAPPNLAIRASFQKIRRQT